MNRVKLLKAGDGWDVVADGHLWSCADLDVALDKAVVLADLHGTEIELGEGVPADAFERRRSRTARGSRVAR